MPDRDKVIKGLEHCSEDGCEGCPYEPDCMMADGFSELARDVLELLKEQEPIKPKRTVDEHGQVLSCGNCGAWFEVQSQKYRNVINDLFALVRSIKGDDEND